MLRSALAAARQLLEKPDTRTEDLLSYLADIEAHMQLLVTPEAGADAEPVKALPPHAWSRLAGQGAAAATSQPSQGRGGRSVGAHLELLGAAAGGTAVVPQEDPVRLLDWLEPEQGEATEREELQQLERLMADTLSLVKAQQEVLELVAEAREAMDAVEGQTVEAISSTYMAAQEVGATAKTTANAWPLKASLGGAALGAVAGACVAGPLGAAVGAGAGTALGGLGGRRAKEHHRQSVDRILDSVTPPPAAVPLRRGASWTGAWARRDGAVQQSCAS